jgi:formamidopyrimidine-DNA glycosylase
VPELPEVETIARDLAASLPGATIHEVEVLRPDLVEGDTPAAFAAKVRGRAIGGVERRAKNLLLELDGVRLAVNLGMTGRLLVAAAEEPDPTHLGVRFTLGDGRELRYHDVRRFGRLWTLDPEAYRRWEAGLGVEPLSRAFSQAWLRNAAPRSRVAVKTWLMDQARVVGVGNIYASEALFRAGVDPRRPARELRGEELDRVRDAVRTVLREAISHRGTTLLDYRDARGEKGSFAARLAVYDREGEPCRRCATAIERIVQGGRSTFFCPRCQA